MNVYLFLALSLFMLNPVLRAQKIDIEKLDPNMTLEKADSQGIAWFDPRAAPFRLVGFPWIDEDKVYRRLPLKPKWPIRTAVNDLANSTAGGQIQFQSNSAKILLRVKLRQPSGMYHMPATGQSGFDLYVGGGRSNNATSPPRDSARRPRTMKSLSLMPQKGTVTSP